MDRSSGAYLPPLPLEHLAEAPASSLMVKPRGGSCPPPDAEPPRDSASCTSQRFDGQNGARSRDGVGGLAAARGQALPEARSEGAVEAGAGGGVEAGERPLEQWRAAVAVYLLRPWPVHNPSSRSKRLSSMSGSWEPTMPILDFRGVSTLFCCSFFEGLMW